MQMWIGEPTQKIRCNKLSIWRDFHIIMNFISWSRGQHGSVVLRLSRVIYINRGLKKKFNLNRG